MRWRVLVAASEAFVPVLSALSFTNPASESVGLASFSNNVIYAEKSVVTIEWTVGTEGDTSSITLWQINLTKVATGSDAVDSVMGNLEYITSKAPD